MSINSIPDNVRQALVTLVPASLINEISCFVFHDNHPLMRKTSDITICTFRGEVKEFYKRELVSYIFIENCSKPREIVTLRNSKCELFYLVALQDEVVILSQKDNLQLVQRIRNVKSYEIEDSMCRGKARIKIVRKDDAVPLIFDDNYEKPSELDIFYRDNKHDTSPLLTDLARKLTEARYSVKCNEKALSDLVHLRHLAAHSINKTTSTNAKGALFVDDKQEKSSALLIKSQKPWIKICKMKIVVILEVVNEYNDVATNVQILLQNSKCKSLIYTTKLYEKTLSSPYWKEKPSNNIQKKELAAVVLIMDLKEIRFSITKNLKLTGVLSYVINEKEYISNLNDITLTSSEIMGENFDVLANIHKEDDRNNILCLLATSNKVELCLRHIKIKEDMKFKVLEMFCKYLGFEQIDSHIIVHLKSPYHILNGVTIVQEDNFIEEDKWIIYIHSRSQSQILAFLHYMHDAIPYRIVATTTNQAIASKVSELCQYNDNITHSASKLNCREIENCIARQAKTTLEYLDSCMMKMNESKDSKVLNKIGTNIDIFAQGPSAFKEFKKKLLEEENNITSLLEESYEDNAEGMIIDLDDD